MERTTYRPSAEPRAFDFDEVTTNPQEPYLYSRADRADHSHHDPMPLFLSDPEIEPDPREFAPAAVRTSAGIATRILAGVVTAAGIALLVALFQSDIARMFIVNARAS